MTKFTGNEAGIRFHISLISVLFILFKLLIDELLISLCNVRRKEMLMHYTDLRANGFIFLSPSARAKDKFLKIALSFFLIHRFVNNVTQRYIFLLRNKDLHKGFVFNEFIQF